MWKLWNLVSFAEVGTGMGVGSWLPLRGIVPGILLLGMGVEKTHD